MRAGGERENYFVLEKCQHGFCVDCLYKYVEKELGAGREEKDEEGNAEKEEQEGEKEEQGEKEGEKEVLDEEKEEKNEPQPPAQPQQKHPDEQKKLVCPLPGCGSEISIRDLSIGLAEFGEKQKQKDAPAEEKKVRQ